MKCPKMGLKFGNILTATLLALLLEEPAHGYVLIERLEEMGLSFKGVPYAVVYRMLRTMEEDGLITSQWDISGNGPSKRIYHVTNEGKKYLKMWVRRAKNNLQVMEEMISKIEKILELGEKGGKKI